MKKNWAPSSGEEADGGELFKSKPDASEAAGYSLGDGGAVRGTALMTATLASKAVARGELHRSRARCVVVESLTDGGVTDDGVKGDRSFVC